MVSSTAVSNLDLSAASDLSAGFLLVREFSLVIMMRLDFPVPNDLVRGRDVQKNTVSINIKRKLNYLRDTARCRRDAKQLNLPTKLLSLVRAHPPS